MNTTKIDLSGLKKLRAMMGSVDSMHAEVGLFADNASRVADQNRIAHNPSLGFVHEFGSAKEKIPERSWLRMPVLTQVAPALSKIDWFGIIKARGVKRALGFMGLMAEETIQEAFATRGWGQWLPLKKRTIQRKGSSAVLIESAQMRQAVASRVVES